MNQEQEVADDHDDDYTVGRGRHAFDQNDEGEDIAHERELRNTGLQAYGACAILAGMLRGSGTERAKAAKGLGQE